MSQDWSTNFFDENNVYSTDMQNIENGLFTLRSMFSGATSPANPLEGAPWMDTEKKVLKSYTGTAWNGLMHGDVNQKLWVYRDSAMAGWVVDASVSDRVLAFKGGTTYPTGGTGAGSWTISGLAGGGHAHGVGTYKTPSLSHVDPTFGDAGFDLGVQKYVFSPHAASAITGTSATGGSGVAVSSSGAWRPLASVGTLQALDL